MDFPPTAWMPLGKIFTWLVDRGITETDAKVTLLKAFERDDIRVRGRYHPGPYDHEILKGVNWSWFEVDWETSEVPNYPHTIIPDCRICDIEASRDDLLKWYGSESDSTETAIPVPEPPKNKGGRRPIYDWEKFNAEIAVRADLDSLPDKQADLVRDMAEWCEAEWGEQPSESTLKSKISPIYNHPRKRAPEK